MSRRVFSARAHGASRAEWRVRAYRGPCTPNPLSPFARSQARPLAVSLLFVSFACGSPAAPAPGNLTVTRFNTSNSSFTWISGFSESMTAVIRDDAAWQSFWATLYKWQTSAPPLPAVDFANEMVVAAGLGSQPSSGYDVLVQSATESQGSVTIETRTLRPSAKCVVLTVVTSPVDLARVPRRTGSVTFHSTEGVNNCGSLSR